MRCSIKFWKSITKKTRTFCYRTRIPSIDGHDSVCHKCNGQHLCCSGSTGQAGGSVHVSRESGKITDCSGLIISASISHDSA